MVSEEIHCLEEVRHMTTAVGQRNQGAKDRSVTWGNLKHMEPKKFKFPYKGSVRHLTNTS